MPEWISVKDRLPTQKSYVLVYTICPNVECQVWFYDENGHWYDECGWSRGEPTHWMPLPEPPKEDSNETD